MKPTYQTFLTQLRLYVVVSLIFCAQSCMVTSVATSHNCDTAENFHKNKKTTWNFAWGLVKPQDIHPKCESGKLHKVQAKTNVGFILISVATLGIAVPQRVEWCCAPVHVRPERLGDDQ